MIKRRFYKEEHRDRDEPSSQSSSSSDSEVEADSGDADGDDNVEVKPEDTHQETSSPSSGYEGEDSSDNEIGADSPAAPIDEDGKATGHRQELVGSRLSKNYTAEVLNEEAKKQSVPLDMPDYVLKFKSVYKCRICPRISCLSEDSLKAHLSSKRHARSEKLLKENRLKVMLNSDGEIENQETAAEMHARIVSLVQDKSKKKNKGRQRQRKRSRTKRNEGDDSKKEKIRGSTKTTAKKKRIS